MDMLKDYVESKNKLYIRNERFNKSEKDTVRKRDKLDQVQRQMWTPTDLFDQEKTIQEIQRLRTNCRIYRR